MMRRKSPPNRLGVKIITKFTSDDGITGRNKFSFKIFLQSSVYYLILRSYRLISITEHKTVVIIPVVVVVVFRPNWTLFTFSIRSCQMVANALPRTRTHTSIVSRSVKFFSTLFFEMHEKKIINKYFFHTLFICFCHA